MQQQFLPFRLVALDLDGTLLNHQGEVTSLTRDALARAAEHGVVLVPTTGRPLSNLPSEVVRLPGIRYVITSNGAAVWDLGQDPMSAVYSRYSNASEHHTTEPVCLTRHLFPPEKAREVYSVYEQYEGELNIFSDGRSHKTPEGMARVAVRMGKYLSTEANVSVQDGRFTVVRGYESWMARQAHTIEKFCMFFDDAAAAQAAMPDFRAIEDVEVVQGSPDNIEVTAKGVDKGEALLELADLLSIPHSQTLAVGDSENDRAMLQKAGAAAVMANGMPQIKALADIVSEADCDHDGVAELFERLHL